MMSNALKAYLDLTRIHFFFVWSLLFCSGLFLSFPQYGGFSWLLVVKAVLIAFLGFEAGFILNDYMDRKFDEKDVEHDKLTKYWRPFGRRPLPSGEISPGKALTLTLIFMASTSALILSLPYPNSAYVLGIMVYSYAAECFYQLKKRNQKHPIAQLIGRTDFSLFPVAGYLCNGQPDIVAVSYFLFFYPFSQAHLGLNDIIDKVNDDARGMKAIPQLYGVQGTKNWILFFTILHVGGAALFTRLTGPISTFGIVLGLLLLFIANIRIRGTKTSEAWLRILPMLHVEMLLYVTSMIADYFI